VADDWPTNMRCGSIRTWPGTLTENRATSPFRNVGEKGNPHVSLRDTLELLERELRMIDGTNPSMLIALPASKFRVDGRPYADARPDHPGVILSFDTPRGPLSFAVDKYSRWDANLRAIGLGLEALRLVKRHGIAQRDEHLRGYLALEASPSTPADVRVQSEDEAYRILERALEGSDWAMPRLGPLTSTEDLQKWASRALARTHPDRNPGRETDHIRVQNALGILKSKGLLA
jgi:hypothetical protein